MKTIASYVMKRKPEAQLSGIAMVEAPYDEDVDAIFKSIMPEGVEPLHLFRVMARNKRVLAKIKAGSLLDRGSLSLREREIIIDRTTARCGAEYEWGVHIAYFAERVGLTPDQIRATAIGDAKDPAWDARERLLIELVDQLHDTATVAPGLMASLRDEWSDGQVLEMLALAGAYHTISFIANAAAVPLESWGARFPDR